MGHAHTASQCEVHFPAIPALPRSVPALRPVNLAVSCPVSPRLLPALAYEPTPLPRQIPLTPVYQTAYVAGPPFGVRIASPLAPVHTLRARFWQTEFPFLSKIRRQPGMAKKKDSSDPGKIKLQPLGDRVVLERDESETVTAGGIVLPDTAKDKPTRGTVVSTG